MTASSTHLNPSSGQSYRYIIAGLCALSLVIFLPFNAAVIDPGPLFAGFRKAPLAYTLILTPHVVTLIACLVWGGSATAGLAKGVSFIAALALGIIVPILVLLTSGLSRESGTASMILLWGVALFAIQVSIYKNAARAVIAARAKGKGSGRLGVALAPVLVILVAFIIPGQMQKSRRELDEIESRKRLLAEMRRQVAVFNDPNAKIATSKDVEDRLHLVQECISEFWWTSNRRYPDGLRPLGAGGVGCIDSVTESGTLGKWKVTLSPRGFENSRGYVLAASDTTGVDRRIVIYECDTVEHRRRR